MVLAAEATKLLKLPTPQPQLGPSPAKAVVHLPMWLWVQDPGTLTSTLTLRGVTVTTRATITGVTWSMGEPVGSPDSGAHDTAIVTCVGPGTPPPAIKELPAHTTEWDPECGYQYRWRSDPKRTGGAGTWPVTATVEWTADWTSNVGAAGSIVMDLTGNTAIEVLELKTRLSTTRCPGAASLIRPPPTDCEQLRRRNP